MSTGCFGVFARGDAGLFTSPSFCCEAASDPVSIGISSKEGVSELLTEGKSFDLGFGGRPLGTI